MAADGSFVIAFTDNRDANNMEIVARRYAASGQYIDAQPFKVNSNDTYRPYNQYNPSIGISASGSFVIGWSSEFQDGWDNGVFARVSPFPKQLPLLALNDVGVMASS
jgi:hypothetical protein